MIFVLILQGRLIDGGQLIDCDLSSSQKSDDSRTEAAQNQGPSLRSRYKKMFFEVRMCYSFGVKITT